MKAAPRGGAASSTILFIFRSDGRLLAFSENKMNIVILAAGMGKRMHSRLPKVLQPIAGRPMIDHVLDASEGLSASPRVVVVGHAAENVMEHLADRSDVTFALQSPQLGTGHALRQALGQLDRNEPKTLVCLGDVPLLSRRTLEAIAREAETSDLVLLTVELDNPTGYGRILRNPAGFVRAIVEEKDASPEERRVREVNTGIMCLPTSRLDGWLSSLKAANAQGEYYLTDVIGLAADEGLRITTVHPEHAWEVEGVNSKAQLASLERVWQREQARRLLDAGVTLIDPSRIEAWNAVRMWKSTSTACSRGRFDSPMACASEQIALSGMLKSTQKQRFFRSVTLKVPVSA